MNEMENRFTSAQYILNNNIGKKFALFHETIFGIERLNGMCKDLGIHLHTTVNITTLPPHVYETYPELNNAGFKQGFVNSEDATKELTRWERFASLYYSLVKSLKEGFDTGYGRCYHDEQHKQCAL